MPKTIKKYIWLFEWIAASLILALGLVIGFVDGVVLLATGISLVLIAILRVIPLFKTLKDKLMRWINLIEIILNLAIGGVMIYLTINAWNTDTDVELGKTFGYLLGASLFVRGVVFFIGTSFRNEHTDVIKFIANILFLSLGVWFVARPTDEKSLGIFVLVIAALCSLFIILDGIKNYNNYRHEYAAEAETRRISKKQKAETELPANDTNKTDDITEPTTEIVPVNEEPTDRPQLNA